MSTADDILPTRPRAWRGFALTAAIVGGVVALIALAWAALVLMAFSSETNRETWTAEEKAAFEARTEHFFVYDAQGREIMLGYLDGQPSSIGVHTGPNSSEQRLLEPGEPFEAFTETGEPWVYPTVQTAQEESVP